MTSDVVVADICVYPVKALQGGSVRATEVEPWGLLRDRRWMVVKPDGRFLTQREIPAMARIRAKATDDGLRLSTGARDDLAITVPAAGAQHRHVTVWRDEVPALDAGETAADWLSAALGIPCGLVYLADTSVRSVDPDYSRPDDRTAFNDGFPVLLANTASLDALNAAMAHSIPMARFRPNIVISGSTAWEEDRWRRIRIGSVTFRIVKPCSRCIVTTVDQETGERPDKTEPLKTLGRMRRAPGGVMFGQNLIPDGVGQIAVGDRVEILEIGESNLHPVPTAGAADP
ncbi:MOSC domain-containing protein [Acidisoma cellulosilytica]|uniref:MOSC domain-containing protein n=1 Tax=Acidisoma cellulosilyticum TaxID=2802395 RepID=A0A963Z1S8_9PROT|nr:MOSC domain-containing protein [Acidisoma cellulosilyticum]MCB8880946.1 MOSC domain-containing protein [Acidisoma cellulosilyticum]